MYLEKVKGEVVYLSLGLEDSNPSNLMHTKRFKLTELAKYLGASEVKVLYPYDKVDDNMIILDYYDSTKDNSFKDSCKLCISVYYCDLNKALTLEEIWSEGNKVGYYSYNKNIATPNKVIQDEKFNFFKFEYVNKDFTAKTFIEPNFYNKKELDSQTKKWEFINKTLLDEKSSDDYKRDISKSKIKPKFWFGDRVKKDNIKFIVDVILFDNDEFHYESNTVNDFIPESKLTLEQENFMGFE